MADLSDLIDGIENTLAGAASIEISQSYDELTEGILQTPTLQVYPQECPSVSKGSSTQKYSFGGNIRRVYIIHADIFVAQRHYLKQDMRDLVVCIEEIDTILKDQTSCEIFGVTGPSTFVWSWRRSNFEYAGKKFLGVKYIFEVEIDV